MRRTPLKLNATIKQILLWRCAVLGPVLFSDGRPSSPGEEDGEVEVRRGKKGGG